MAGHSHWANIQRSKGAADSKRGKVFSKLSRYIMIAARNGGGDPDMNLKLRYAIDKARAVSMPKENIERAIKKGTGELEGETLEELTYEGYGHGGVAIIVEATTDNRARSSGEIRKIFERAGGKMGQPGSVAWMFERKGVIVVDAKTIDEDKLMEIALEGGAEDIRRAGANFEVICDAASFHTVQTALAGKKVATLNAELTQLPKTPTDVSIEDARKVLNLMENLDEHDDVQNVYSTMNLTDEIVAAANAG